jgi:protein TonB
LPDQPTPQPDQPVEAVAVSPPVPPPKAAAFDLPPGPASQPPLNHDLESAYLSGLRAYIDSRTSPPDTAEYRLLHPHGEAVVRFTLSRLGAVHDVSIAKSSGSPMLDEQARTIVAGGNYPPFPAETYRSETEHVFTVHIEFRPGTHGVL